MALECLSLEETSQSMQRMLGGAHIGALRVQFCSLFYDRRFPLTRRDERGRPPPRLPLPSPRRPPVSRGSRRPGGTRGPARAEERAGPRTAPPPAPPPAGSRKRPRGWAGLGEPALRGAHRGQRGRARRPPETPRAPCRVPGAVMARGLRSLLGSCLVVSGEEPAGSGRRTPA